ncbi:tRNA (N6-isopentenyl adenosine(37)-C2)-methylthiotransferase MiaB [Anaplasma marginale]|uniref:tRNA (N6-isopentenyl adenosine(37)-C2)-methylthiotransferase MiaB n=1 Tax=Anaplasma marginale TaxID=770 RepID=UPI000E56F9E7|nr:tRNA (N6-isopentenyl adenosine(37)-C2)-methylthiotransferase MiaB [Anaplasma marginale]AXW84833.1 tRNA (N6-isopentenyl adenosine(37)-C2)-methylthiotransferase MiaB [Anaplasma marginale]KAA8473091.1 tRNA (N6-isopentenyl adenosine(37)-C2)-methylthiotransferase MiaB [Anaplasma marginale]KAB0451451.1 tRNA (N6-isopentenyl adenosine(37)-C2)-methylthiotransferase MiaB [Anaplasma marginale]KAB0453396.1 tRNA (N6-isopentenyl adenosine(37)-C2)-methylthiotransferase MiaB [Anaplasma marginale]TZF79283.1
MTKGLYIESYGCQMNVYDSLMVEDILRPLGFAAVQRPEDADIIMVNTCHVREKAAEKLYSALGRMRMLRKEGALIVVAGCVAQAEGEAVFERAPFVDVVVGPQSIHTLPELIMKATRDAKQMNVEFPAISKFDVISTDLLVSRGVSAFVSVQEGCDKFCTFCVVPYTRGPEYSRSVEDVLAEVRKLADGGTKEVVLLGQNVNAYHGTYKGNEWDLGRLIRKVAEVDGIERIRYTTSHPKDMHSSLYDAHKHEPKLLPCVHLPVQSGSDSVLRKMNRKHSVQEYMDIIDTLKEARSDIALSSDFIVGFPGETEEDFEATMNLVRHVGFATSYSFKYSPRPGTPGAEYTNQVPEEEKSSRLHRLQHLLLTQQRLFTKSMIGKTVSVLVCGTEGSRSCSNEVFGKSEHMQPVYISVDGDPAEYRNKIFSVKVLEEGARSSLKGVICADTIPPTACSPCRSAVQA